MEENKAAAYHDELLRKGGGAARFKQGLGYDARSSETVAANSSYPLSRMFVKGASRDDNLAVIEKEIRLANVRDKLKKHDVGGSNNRSSVQKLTTNDKSLEHDVRQGVDDKEIRRLSKNSNATSPERGSDSFRHRSKGSNMCPSKRHPGFRSHDRDGVDVSFKRERKRRHTNQDSACNSGSCASEVDRKSSYSSSGDSHDGHHRRRGRRQRRSRSWSSSEKGRIRSTVKRSHSHVHSQQSTSSSDDSREARKQAVKRGNRRTHSGSRGIKPLSRRSKSLSSSGCSSEDHRCSHWKPQFGSHRSSNHKCGSPCKQRKEEGENQRIVRDRPGGKKLIRRDYSKIIPGYDSMTPAERVKAKMKLQLSETVVKDSSKGMSGEWERFDFNKEAPLDDDARLDYFGDGTETRDDTGFLQNTGSTFMSSNYQARREAQVQEDHDAAIFGVSIGSTSVGKETHSRNRLHRSVSVGEPVKDNARVQLDHNSLNKNLLSDQVMAMQHVSWRERALKLKE